MNKDEKQRITQNLVYITGNTKDLKRFVITLICEGLLSKGDKQVIDSLPDEADKVYHVYHEVMKYPRYSDLVDILDDTGNKDIADKLRDLPSYKKLEVPKEDGRPRSPGLDDFPVSRSGASEIVYILSEYSSLQDVWVANIARPLLSARSFSNLKTDAVHTSVMMKTLDAWRDDKGKDATLRSLAKIIDPYNHAASIALLDNAKKIRLAS